MRNHECDREDALLAAGRAGALGALEREHLASCATCGEALAVEAALAPLAAAPDAGRAAARLPSAHQVLLRARLEARRAEAERSLRPLLLWTRVAAAVAAAAVGVGIVLAAPALSGLASPSALASASPARAIFGLGLLALAAAPFLLRRRAAV